MLLVKDTSLYAYVPLNVVGMLVSFMLAGLMSALNWKRLGNPRRMWISIGVTLLGVGWTYPKLFRLSALGLNMPEPETARPLVSFIQSLPFLVDLGVHVVATVVATWGLKTPCQEHVRAGGARSSVLLPLGLYLGPLIVWGLFSDITRR
ncbi:MAG TPA: hypothetical protein VK539_27960 [Myxococcaceae bacterium]|nr:hypothetical protein [Myxococcaceae bacterium]